MPMSAEQAAAMATDSEPVPRVQVMKGEASEAPSRTGLAPATNEAVKTESSEGPAQIEATEAPITAPIQPEKDEKDEKDEKVEKVEKVEDVAETPLKSESTPVSAPAPAPVPAAAAEKGPEILGTPNAKLIADLPAIIKEAEHNEIWGVELKDDVSHVPTTIVIEKFLRANTKDVAKAKAQLIEALRWRKKVDPCKLLAESEFDNKKFAGLGYVTVYPKTETHEKEIVTWNIYGSVKDFQGTFGNVEEFVKWRAAIMELSVQELDLPSATVPIPADGVDPYRMIQVHDYMNVSFLRMDPAVKAASKETIKIFSMAYPELLKEKFFVNVPLVMGWVFSAMKLFLSPETVKKFHPLAYGSSLAGECKGWGEELPSLYGGKGKDVKDGLTVKYTASPEVEKGSGTQG